jgi:hypothetical protein
MQLLSPINKTRFVTLARHFKCQALLISFLSSLLGTVGSSTISSTPLPMAKDILLFFSVPILLSLLLLYTNFIIKWSSEKRKRRKMNLPPGMSLGLPLLGETLAYLKPHEATSIGHFMDHHIRRYSEFSISFQ